jgi:tRNA/tmRNA/rRNA uracil-C5-methylase (TrmA/RlmC/RlmD family)
MEKPAGFFQATEMLNADPAGVLAKVGIKSGMDVIDLCSGDGWFTLQIARLARFVVAIDIDPSLLEVSSHRLREANMSNCEFIAGDAYSVARLWTRPVDFVFLANASTAFLTSRVLLVRSKTP